MSPSRWSRVRALFDGALSHPPGPERDRWLRRACGSDRDLLDEVRALLEGDDSSLPLLEATPDALAAAVRPLPDDPPARGRVGPYTVRREIGRGGMATVYLAEREDVGLRVALKLVRGGPAALAAPETVDRFLLERRLLARLEHPHVARLLDSGIAEDGTPWFAMELVDGEPITDFCQRHALPTLQRVDLFRKVCDAVAFAHHNLVVHRDLKPSNVLVTGDAADPTPKLLDFGIAKRLSADPLGDEPLTRTGVRALTVAYAAPEQLRGNPVTTAADVYALGILLHEVLTGRRPFDAADGADHDGIEPPPAERPVRTDPSLDVDLRTIVEKALESSVQRRYPSAAALGDDLGRYREGLPVRARRPTTAYRARKFVARHRTMATAAAVATLSLVGGLGAAVWQATEASRERDRAQEALRQSEQVRAFLSDMFNAAQPQPGRESVRSLNELLEQGVERADRLEDQPVVQADVLHEVAQVFDLQGEYGRAEALFRRVLEIREEALGDVHPSTAETLRWLGDAVLPQGRLAEAEALYRKALAIQRYQRGATDPATIETLQRLGSVSTHRGDLDAAYDLYRTAFDRRRATLGPNHPAVAESLRLLAVTRRRQGRYQDATRLYRESLAVMRRAAGTESAGAGWALVHLGDQLFFHNADTARAEPLYLEALRILELELGPDHPDLLHGLHSLASLREAVGASDEAERLRRRSRDLVRTRYGERHWRMADELNLLGRHLRHRGRLDEAEELHHQALAIYEATYEPGHSSVFATRVELTEVYLARGEAARAERLARQLLGARERSDGPRHVMTALDVERVARTLVPQGRLEEAETLFRRALDIYRPHRADQHRDVRRVLRHLVELYERQDRPDHARTLRLRLQETPDAAIWEGGGSPPGEQPPRSLAPRPGSIPAARRRPASPRPSPSDRYSAAPTKRR